MWKAIFAGTTALTLIGGSLVYAQDATPRAQNISGQHHPRTAEERAAYTDARIADLKTNLHLTAAQEKNWATFEAVLRDTAKARAARFEQFRKMREGNATTGQAPDRAAMESQDQAEQKKLAAALDPFYKSLDANQKQVFAAKFDVDGEGRHYWFKRQHDSDKS